jgi:hypothetical protein
MRQRAVETGRYRFPDLFIAGLGAEVKRRQGHFLATPVKPDVQKYSILFSVNKLIHVTPRGIYDLRLDDLRLEFKSWKIAV